MNRKRIMGTLAVSLCVCAMLVFNFGFLPGILSRAPENSGVETIDSEGLPPDDGGAENGDAAGGDGEAFREDGDPYILEVTSYGEPGDSDIIDINAIPVEQAIETAMVEVLGYPYRTHPITGEKEYTGNKFYEYNGSTQVFTIEYLDIRYFANRNAIGDPTDSPSWFVLFKESIEGDKYEYIPFGRTAEDYLAMHKASYPDGYVGTDSEGTPVIILPVTVRVNYTVVEINALTGKFIASYTVEADSDLYAMTFFFSVDREGLVSEPTPQPD